MPARDKDSMETNQRLEVGRGLKSGHSLRSQTNGVRMVVDARVLASGRDAAADHNRAARKREGGDGLLRTQTGGTSEKGGRAE